MANDPLKELKAFHASQDPPEQVSNASSGRRKAKNEYTAASDTHYGGIGIAPKQMSQTNGEDKPPE